MFLTKTLGWTEGLDEEHDATLDPDPNDVKTLAKYEFLAKQTGWYKGLKLFGERERRSSG